MKLFLLTFFSIAVLVGCKSSSEKNLNSSDSTNNNESVVMNDSTKTDSSYSAVIKTNIGNIEVELFSDKAPRAVENFVGLARKGYYNGIIFHRVIDNFMIQGGDPTGTGRGGESLWGGYFEDEISPDLVFDKPGILAMANAGPNTNGSQFFITTVPTPWLNGHHTIFGKVTGGMDVLNKISKVQTTKPYDKPVKDVVMNQVIIESKPLKK